MKWVGSPILWAVAGLALLLLLANLFHSSVTAQIPTGPQVTCDGNTGIKPERLLHLRGAYPGDERPLQTVADRCLRWAEDLLRKQRLQFPTSVGNEAISSMVIERAFFGFINRCTVTVTYSDASSHGSFEQVIPCRFYRGNES
jgi:hypothetical protein